MTAGDISAVFLLIKSLLNKDLLSTPGNLAKITVQIAIYIPMGKWWVCRVIFYKHIMPNGI